MKKEANLLEYWNKHKFELAKEHDWMCNAAKECSILCPDADGGNCQKHCIQYKNREEYCKSLISYTNYIEKINKHIEDIPIYDLSLSNITYAMRQIKTNSGGKYSESSLECARTALNGIFSYAAVRGDAYNIMKGLSVKKPSKAGDRSRLLRILVEHSDTPARVRAEIEKELAKRGHKPRSLNISQIEKLSNILTEKITTDGRICLIALMLYAGVRPAEGRALRWRDIVPLNDHPEVSIINIYRIRNRTGRISALPKTDNAFRRIPVHSELAQLLKTRLDYIKIENPKHSDNDPICCFENNFARPCKDFQAALKADEIFSQINISTEEMYGYALECALEQLNNSKKTNDVQHLTLYALRRNFWTWLESLSGLADMEKRYVMGHEMIKDGKDIRKTYNDENLLYEIYQKMTRSLISFERHEELTTVRVDRSHPVCDQNAGIRKIVIPEELLRKGGTLTIFAVTTEPGDALILASKRALPRRETTVNEIPATHQWTRINCGFEEWLAHRKRNRALKR